MHETVVAQNLLETILHESKQQEGRPISAKISCGQLDAVNDDTLNFAFEVIAQGTRCEGMTLQIEHKPVQARCERCNEVYAIVGLAEVRCPHCGRNGFELLPDAPLLLEEIAFEKE
jgi:hydrogenase nickel incorporation protein HypA/HybF